MPPLRILGIATMDAAVGKSLAGDIATMESAVGKLAAGEVITMEGAVGKAPDVATGGMYVVDMGAAGCPKGFATMLVGCKAETCAEG